MKIIFSGLIFAAVAFAQDPVAVTPFQLLVTDSNSGLLVPCAGCFIETFVAGTNTHSPTYTNSSLGVANTNPVRTNGSGYAVNGSTITGIWVGATCLKLVAKDANSATLWTQDSVCDQAQVLKALLAGVTGAAQIGYKYSSSATLRTVASRLQEEESLDDFGAVGNDSTDNTAAIDAALAASTYVTVPTGIYKYGGSMTTLFVNGRRLIGKGSQNSTIKFTNSTVTALVEGTTPFADATVSGVFFRGPGKIAGTNVHGIYVHPAGAPYGLRLNDVGVGDVSGNGIYIRNAFDAHYENVWVENIGCGTGAATGAGILMGGDQSTTFINSGRFNINVGNTTPNPTGSTNCFGWWFFSGAPFLQGLNTSDVPNGAMFGSTASDPFGIQFATPTIFGMNVETVHTGGVGILFNSGSNASFAAGITLYCENGETCDKGVYWKGGMGNPGMFVPLPAVVSGSGGTGVWTDHYFCDGPGFPNHGVVLSIGDDQTANMSTECKNAALINQIIPSVPSAGGPLGFSIATQLRAPGLVNGGHFVANTRTVTDSTDTVLSTDHIVFLDATAAPITETIPAAGTLGQGTELIFKKIDSTTNQVALSNGFIDGISGYTLGNQNQTVTMVSNAGSWRITDEKNLPWLNPRGYGNGTVAGLPSCTSAAGAGLSSSQLAPQVVIDSNTSTLGAVVAAGGSARVIVACNYYTGHWLITADWAN